MLVKLARTVYRELYLEIRVYCAYFIRLAEGVAKILCCEKLAFVLYTISL